MASGATLGAGSFEQYMEHSPDAVALTRGPEYELVYMNPAFRRLVRATGASADRSIGDVFANGCPRGLIELLDRVLQTGGIVRDVLIASSSNTGPGWLCSVWPGSLDSGGPECLVLELSQPSDAERWSNMQREVTERAFASALHELDAAQIAEDSERRSAFLSAESRRFGESLDECATLRAIASTALPRVGAWCIVDVFEPDDRMRRLTMVHGDPAKQELLRGLENGGWAPRPGDAFGLPAMVPSARTVSLNGPQSAEAIAATAGDAATLDALHAAGIGPLLTVPLLIGEQLVGAMTFVARVGDRGYGPDEIVMAQALASRAAIALDHARIHGELVALQSKTNAASEAKSAFLGTISHELRTPLNAIGGFVELIEMGLRGPVTAEQRADLERIKRNQRHLLALITDVLNFVRIGNDRVVYRPEEVSVAEVVAASVGLVEPLIAQKALVHRETRCSGTVAARADPERVTQIVVNLLSNAIKFTPPGGRLDIECEAVEQHVLIHVSDTGIGIPPEMVESIFDPFVQVRAGLAGRDTGAGLGLAISRGLARAMGGDLTVVSTVGSGSRFTLALPAVPPPVQPPAER